LFFVQCKFERLARRPVMAATSFSRRVEWSVPVFSFRADEEGAFRFLRHAQEIFNASPCRVRITVRSRLGEAEFRRLLLIEHQGVGKSLSTEPIAKLFCPLLCRPGAFAASKCF